jgi:thioesterase domain-containing protein
LFDTYGISFATDAEYLPEDAAFLLDLLAIDELLVEQSLLFDDIKQLLPDEQLCRVIEYAKSVNWVPPDFSLAEAQRLIKLFRSHSRAGDKYIPQPYQGKVTLFLASEEQFHDPTLGWGKLADGVEIHLVSGNHQSIVSKPHVEILAEQLRVCLAQSPVNGSGALYD